MNTISYNFAKQVVANFRLWSTFRSQSTQCYSFYAVNIMCRVGYILCSSISALWNSSCICCSSEKLRHYLSQKLKLVLLIASLFISQYLCKFLEIPRNLLECWNSVYLKFLFFPLKRFHCYSTILFNFLGLYSLLFEKIAFTYSTNIPHTFKLYALGFILLPSPCILFCILWFPKFLWKILIFKEFSL